MTRPRNEVSASPIGLRVRDKLKLIDRIGAGFPYRTLERLQEALEISASETAEVVRIPLRTLSRLEHGVYS